MRLNADSDDAESSLSETVSEYYLMNEEEQPICFSVLPIKWSENEGLDAHASPVYLHGSIDNGLQKIYKQVVAWKVDIRSIHPQVWLLSKDQRWFKVIKPRKSYEATIRSVLVTLKCLSYLRKNPNSSDRSLWENVEPTFRLFENGASKRDLLKHLSLVKMMLERYEEFSRSELLWSYLRDSSRLSGSNKKSQKIDFIEDDNYDDDYDEVEDDEDGDEDDCFDTVCAICDDGGEVLCCEGKCLRSFHATRDAAGPDSCCKTLGYTRAQVEEMPNFLCPNCLVKKHQCFYCGKLGNSDVVNAEVYRCISASCGHYYHPRCAASLIHRKRKDQAADLEKRIASGEPFTCSAHKCIICDQVENKNVEELQFAICRRCPKSYHRKCLPRDISLEDRPEEGIKQRAWDGLIPNRILIYCRRHVIDEFIGTPSRDHIVFPLTFGKRKLEDFSREISDYRLTKTTKRAPPKGETVGKSLSGRVSSSRKESTGPAVSSKTLSECSRSKGFFPERTSPSEVGRTSYSEMNYNKNISLSETRDTGNVPILDENVDKTLVLAKSEAKKRIMQFVENASVPSVTAEISLKKTRVLNNAFHVDKKITQGKVEGSIEAIRAALKKLDSGCSVEDAKAVCGPDVLRQVLRWKRRFRVYLAPFLHGMRYTSYGRHFTKVQKLKEIVNRLHWYVQNDDMIVDFCCGANDFSLLMREKLEERGKRCFFKNYDLFPPMNDFNFEKRDWMTVCPSELPPGTQLIMGLNPPFGVRAAHANKFIDKALEFKPKLIILIVPKETERLDQKPDRYDLIWEDETILSGKSFYLPGSIDVKDKQMDQWNIRAPSLYLWSRPDWTTVHRGIAVKLGHAIPEPGTSQPIIDVHHQISTDKEYLVPHTESSPSKIGRRRHFVDTSEGNFNGTKMAGCSQFIDQNQANSNEHPRVASAAAIPIHIEHDSEDPSLGAGKELMVRHGGENCVWPHASPDGGWIDE